MPANSNPLRIINMPTSADIGQFIAVDSNGVRATAGAAAIGFTTAAAKSGSAVPVCVMGSAVAWAGAAITIGQALEIGASGFVVPRVSGAQIGTALNTAAVGDQVEVLIATSGAVSGAGIVPGVTAASTSAASANVTAIKAALAVGNAVVPGNLGLVYLNRTVLVPSNRSLVVGVGTWLTRIPGVSSYILVRNAQSHGCAYVNGLTISGGQITVQDPGHPYSVGDVIYCENWQGNSSLNGPQTIVAAVEGVSWTIAASGGNPTNTSVQCVFTSYYNPRAGSNFVRASNVVTVTEPGHQRGVGDRVWIAGLGGTNTFNGVAEVVSTVPGVSWTYANTGANETATGTAQLLGDRLIDVRLSLDGNTPNLSGTKQATAHLSMWGNVSHLTERYDDVRNGQTGRGSNHYNVTDNIVPYASSSNAGGSATSVAVLLQWDSYCDRVQVGDTYGFGQTDDQIAWGVTSNAGPFADTAAPTGPGNMGTLNVGTLNGKTATGILKLYCTTSYNAGKVKVSRVLGSGPVAIGDPSAGVSGGSLTSLTIDECDNIPDNVNAQILLGSNAWATLGVVKIGKVTDNLLLNTANTAATANNCVSVYAPATSITIENYFSAVPRTGASHILHRSTAPLAVLNSQCDFGNATMGLVEVTSAACESVTISNNYHNGSVGQFGYLYGTSVGGYAKRVYMNNIDVTNIGALFRVGTASGGLTHEWTVNNVRVNTCGSVFNDNSQGTFNINAVNLNCAATGNNMIQISTAASVVNFRGRNVRHPAGQACLFTGTTQIRIDCQELGIDLGANGAAPPSQLTPTAGDMVTNTNATGPGIYGRTAAGAWTKIV